MADWLQYSFSNQLVAPPTGSQLRLNAADLTATRLWVTTDSSDGIDAYYALLRIAVGSTLIVQDKNDHTRAVKFTTTGPPVDYADYVEIAVQGVETTGWPNNGQAVLLVAIQPYEAVTPPTPIPGDFVIAPWSQPSTVTRLVATPAIEPLTVEEVKLRASMSWPVTDPPDPRDGMIADFIRAARAKVELDTGLALLTQVRDVTFGDSSIYTTVVPLPANCLPVQSIEDVTPAVARRGRRPRAVYRTFELVPGTSRHTVSALTVDAGTVMRVTCGWPSVEALKAEAPLLHQAVGLLASHYATLGRDLAITGAVAAINIVPEGYEALIAPHRLQWVA